MSDNKLVKLGKVTVTVEFEGPERKLPESKGIEKILEGMLGNLISEPATPNGHIDPKCKETEEKSNTSFKTSEKPSED